MASVDRKLQIGCAVAVLVAVTVGSLLFLGPLGIVVPIILVALAGVIGTARPTKIR